MEVLDGDVVRLSSRGREAERDIVQVSHCYYLLIQFTCLLFLRIDLHILRLNRPRGLHNSRK